MASRNLAGVILYRAPPFLPRARAEISPALVRSEMSSRSYSTLCTAPHNAHFERELLRERQKEGIELAKRAGAYKGRKRILTTERASELPRRLAGGERKAALAREFGIDRVTVYRYMGREVKRPAFAGRKLVAHESCRTGSTHRTMG
jgi:Helix-turn-helix domain of resolvase